jgi:putative ABC transport system permease protein
MGIASDRIFVSNVALRERSYPDETSRQAFYIRLLEEVGKTAGIEAVTLANPPVFNPPLMRPVEGTSSSVIAVTADYFSTLHLPLIEGRLLTHFDRMGSESVAMVSRTLARRLWPTTSAVGQAIRIMNSNSANASSTTRTIVGVVDDARQATTDEDLADVYVPLLQTPSRFASIHVRSSLPSTSLMTALRQVMKDIDPEVFLSPIQDVQSIADDQLVRPRFLTSLLSAFALLALVLALIGIYGVIAYTVKQREHEIAVRMAVGASARSVIVMFMREGTIVIAAGVAVGIFGARAIGEMLQSQLFGLQPFDSWTIIAMSFLIALSGLIATWWPARRAAGTDPILALREE